MISLREVFLSYHHKDRRAAGRLKRELSQYGLTAFLAHEDLAVSSQWRREILRHLSSCVAIVPIITSNFYKSDWTCQEVGVAIGKEKTIISLVLEERIGPRGFMESFQYARSSKISLEHGIRQIANVLNATKLSQSKETREAYQALAGILNMLLLTWENRALRRRNSMAIAEIKYKFGGYSEELDETLSLYKDVIDPRTSSSFKALIKATKEYLRWDSDDYEGLDRKGKKLINRGTELMQRLREKIPKSWQKKYLDADS
jgi:hypothetical protein